ncbi:Fumarylacetoacetate (FAA) hydrolase domain-containing protein [Tieghemostelium lacteum]|uniref:Fumarylacetoacetate (FAA) hydrolase domain-containing protein n=1 Tax=Tieghemostelium lacteum TaxID=361077 RepID=A0A151ZI33_TIELA|nr:Fumarylacetoacetate (FAA) hydrolase domain-containing protein [Tieghemostelium lacteum]|eukprot:KYQ93626.1 Fumarylacetoacetate (FAA) hydrolase domain-containing protein [Tieghemostelium lacteum]
MKRFWETGKKIVAIGRNYASHAKELGNDVPTEPFFFLKPTSSYLLKGTVNGAIEIPNSAEADVHHEVELGIVISKKGRDIHEKNAMDFVGGYTLALDMTSRDLQNKAKAKGLPWSVAKGYDTYCPVSGFIPKEKIPNPFDVELWCSVDGEMKQKGSTKDMIFKIPFLIQYVSSIMTLEEGDLILTGTPQGVGPVKPGQTIKAGITGVEDMEFKVIKRPLPNY